MHINMRTTDLDLSCREQEQRTEKGKGREKSREGGENPQGVSQVLFMLIFIVHNNVPRFMVYAITIFRGTDMIYRQLY